MSPFDTIFGAIMVGLCAAWFLALLVVGLCRAAAKPAPVREEYEMSPYGPILAGLVDRCSAHRPHVMASTADGQWICTRCQQTWATDDDFTQWEREVSA